MPTNRTQAAKLLNAAEMEVFNTSIAPVIRELDGVRLAGKVKRARTLRDKFRDLLQRQAVATRVRTGTKIGNSGSANQRTSKKAEIFGEVLERLSARLAQVQAAAAREATRAEKAKSTSAAKSAKTARKPPSRAPASNSAKSTVKAAVKLVAAKKAATRKTASRHLAGEPPARSDKASAVAKRARSNG